MQLRPRFLGRLGAADVVTVANAALGFAAAVAATIDPQLAARLVLLAAIADGLDGVLARVYGSTQVGEYVDSLADVASFGVAPAVFVYVIASREWGLELATLSVAEVVTLAIPALYVAAAVVRLAMYTAYDLEDRTTRGVQTTLAATVLAAAYLSGVTDPAVLLGATGLFVYLMITTIEYPELAERDALAMGVVQAGAVLAPLAFARVFPRALLAAALAYLLLAPVVYPRSR
ncbi:Phosphatidylserine synthase [Halapricum desulfuricans]|uniref:Phosphatidylserine synthase n=1 Tax=Halapricum desulfuricans TaxID=2841257 RepID=A0A897NIJ6_9EURY|nr:protein sorting system archaetidylserine synthase [Halapricum desulfuricans]QSG12428.1 Phosphatidylserine synthase [Halapricum desulfuricans]